MSQNISNSVWNISREAAQKGVINLLLEEISPRVIQKIQQHNPNIDQETILERYLEYLKKELSDPRHQFLWDLYYKRIPSNEADQALDIIKNRTHIREKILHTLQNGLNQDEPIWLWVQEWHELTGSVIKFNEEEMISIISTKERKTLGVIINSLVIGNMWLTLWELIPSMKWHVDYIYEELEQISNGLVSWDHSVGLVIISVFWYEAFVKIKEVWLIPYLKHNKWDAALNILWWVELWTIAVDTLTGEVHPWVASILRSFRALRLLKVLGKIDSVKELYDSVTEAAPGVAKITGIYGATSVVAMIMLSELTKGHVEEFSTLWGAMNEMRNLFYGDGFQPILESIEKSETMDIPSKIVASWMANGYQLLSSTFYFAIPTALFADIVNKSWVRIEQIASMTLERVDEVIKIWKNIQDTLWEIKDTLAKKIPEKKS